MEYMWVLLFIAVGILLVNLVSLLVGRLLDRRWGRAWRDSGLIRLLRLAAYVGVAVWVVVRCCSR